MTMNNQRFIAIMQHRITACQDVMGAKSAEYATDTDKLANFREIAIECELPLIKVAQVLGAKHFVSVRKIIRDVISGKFATITDALMDEKFTDAINYLIILEAITREAQDEHEREKAFTYSDEDLQRHPGSDARTDENRSGKRRSVSQVRAANKRGPVPGINHPHGRSG